MAAPHVLYYCPCGSAHSRPAATPSLSSSSSSSSQPHSASLASPPPGLPAHAPASRYSFQPLESLFFCDECDQIRCNRCVTLDISSYYCPNCLFEVAAASVKAEKNRCPRNCFVCPCCQHTLSVLASDLNAATVGAIDPTDPAASQGEPPFYLGCTFCRWDSKSIGLTFEKPTGLSLQVQRSQDNAPDILEFERLKDHFEPYLKTQTKAAITSASLGNSSSSRSRSASSSNASASTSSSASTSQTRTARSNAARTAAAAALQSSKLVRDLPHLANSKLSSSSRSIPIEPDELKTYRALNPWQPTQPSDARTSAANSSAPSMGVIAKREKHRRDYIARAEHASNQPAASLDDKISSLQQRWSSVAIADQPVRAADLRPARVPLKSKLSKRCPACRHIVIKSDIKADSTRFKIKLVAPNFLPELKVALAPHQPYVDLLRYRKSNAAISGPLAGSLRRKPQSTLGPHSTSTISDSLGSSSALQSSAEIDVDTLVAGQTYSFQLTITNPLDDPIQVTMSFVRFALAAQSNRLTSSPDRNRHPNAVKPLPEPKYLFSSGPHSGNMPTSSLSQQKTQSHGTEDRKVQEAARKPKFGWQVYPSATTVPLNAFNEVWELEESEEIYSSGNAADADHDKDDGNLHQDGSLRRQTVKTAIVRVADPTGSTDESAWVIEDEEEQEDDQAASFTSSDQRKPFVQKGHTTSLYLDLAISSKDPPRPGPLELAMHVTYRYTGRDGQGLETTSSADGKDFSFWTSIRLGTVADVAPSS